MAFTLGAFDLVAIAGELSAEFDDRVLGDMVLLFYMIECALDKQYQAGPTRAKRGGIGQKIQKDAKQWMS